MQTCLFFLSNAMSNYYYYYYFIYRTKRDRDVTQSSTVTLLWMIGFVVRYCLLVPVRLVLLVISLSTLVICTFLVGRLSSGKFKRKLNAFVVCWSFDFVANTLSIVARYKTRVNIINTLQGVTTLIPPSTQHTNITIPNLFISG